MDWSWSLALENTLLIVTKLTQCLQSTLCLVKLLSLSSQGTRQLPVLVSDYGFTKNLLTGQKSLLFILKVLSTLDHLQDKDKISAVISTSSRYEDFNHEKLSKETFDSNVPLNLHKKVSNAQGNYSVSLTWETNYVILYCKPY